MFQNPNDTVAGLRRLGAAALIRCFAKRVLAAVEFDRQLALGAGESDDASPDRMLAAKFPRRKPLAQREPQKALDIRGVSAQAACHRRPGPQCLCHPPPLTPPP